MRDEIFFTKLSKKSPQTKFSSCDAPSSGKLRKPVRSPAVSFVLNLNDTSIGRLRTKNTAGDLSGFSSFPLGCAPEPENSVVL